jgi:hypothetical protein
MNALRVRHNRIKARIKYGVDKPGDKEKLKKLAKALGYDRAI